MGIKTYNIGKEELLGILRLTSIIDDKGEVWGKDTNLGELDTILLEIKACVMNIIDRNIYEGSLRKAKTTKKR